MRTFVPATFIVCLLLAGSNSLASDSTPAGAVDTLREASVAFLDALGPELSKQVVFSLDDEERRAWSNLPYPMFDRQGVSFAEMSPEQRAHAHALLRSALSSRGYLKTTGIMQLDELLKDLTDLPPDAPVQFGHDLYWISMFGNPAEDSAWGWQLDGHHLALNITVVGDAVSVRPAFMGADPAAVLSGTYAGWYVLFNEDETGRRLFASLDDAQRAKATVAKQSPEDVITGPGKGDRLDKPEGLPAAEMTQTQRLLLIRVIEEYVYNYKHDIAHEQMHRIMASGMDDIYFAWAGTGEAEPYYYRVHGPTVIIEFTNMYPPGQTSGPINHIHTVFREPGNDYAEDLLRKHLEESPHHNASKD